MSGVDLWEPSSAMRSVRDGVAEICGVEPYQIIGRCRQKPLVEYRHLAVWVVRQCFPDLSFPMIGRLFGGRDHSTMIHACRNIDNKRDREPKFRELSDTICEGFGVRATRPLELSPDVRLRMEKICDQFQRTFGPPATLPPVEPRRVLPRNDFSGDDSSADMLTRGSRDLLRAQVAVYG